MDQISHSSEDIQDEASSHSHYIQGIIFALLPGLIYNFASLDYFFGGEQQPIGLEIPKFEKLEVVDVAPKPAKIETAIPVSKPVIDKLAPKKSLFDDKLIQLQLTVVAAVIFAILLIKLVESRKRRNNQNKNEEVVITQQNAPNLRQKPRRQEFRSAKPQEMEQSQENLQKQPEEDTNLILIKRAIFGNPVVQSIYAAADHPVGFWVVGAIGLYALLEVYSIALEIVTHFVGIIYPIFKSFEALQSPDKTKIRTWLCYWMFYSIFAQIDQYGSWILDIIPLYNFIKLGVLILLQNPAYNFSQVFCDEFILPFHRQYKAQIDAIYQINSLWMNASNLIQHVQDFIQGLIFGPKPEEE